MLLGRRLISTLLGLLLVASAVPGSVGFSPPTALSATSLGLSGITPSATSVGLYGKLELTFDVDNTVATNPQLPYDPAPPPGLPGRVGVSVEGLFLQPGESDWTRARRQPGFLYQGYSRQRIGSTEWVHPEGPPVWKVRFAPKVQGTWQYRVRAQDASICPPGLSPCPHWVQSDPATFSVGPATSGNHGFVEVSRADPRYFVLSDGSLFVGLGHGTSFSDTYAAEESLDRYSASGASFFRAWMTGTALAGSAWSPWVWFGGPGYVGYLYDPGLVPAPDGSGYDFTLSLSHEANRLCLFNGFSQGHVAVRPSTTYRLSMRARVSGVSGPRDPSRPEFGLTAKLGGWPDSCPDGLAGASTVIPHLQNAGWTTVQGTVTTGASQWFLDYLYLALDNVSSGQADVADVSLKEVLAGGGLGPELLPKSRGDAHLDYNLLSSWKWDYILDRAAERGVYLKLVVLEKNDRVWNLIGADGAVSAAGDNDNFYAAPNTKVRRLHEYYWRYLAARWGYSTAIHSWELLNEGDPFNGHHHEQANSFARFMHETEPSRHLVTTSNWHSFPVAELWGNPQYPDLDYADLHAYVSTGPTAYEWSPPSGAALETDPASTHQSSRGALRVPAGVTSGTSQMWLRGQGSWRISARVRAEGLAGTCPFGAPASLAGPQLIVTFEGVGTRAIPTDPSWPESYWICTSPAGTYDYRLVEGTIAVPDDAWHLFHLELKTAFATSGTAWFDDLRIIGPDGREARLLGDGTFDDRDRLDHDTAAYTDVYARLHGARSISGAAKPVVRGEAGIAVEGGNHGELADLSRDANGVWLHNYLWATLGPGGMYELYWWTDNITSKDLYFQFKPLSSFLADVPLANGRYRDAEAVASDSNTRVVGQKDLSAQRAHLWIRSSRHTWWNVVSGVAPGRLAGTVGLPGLTPGRAYSVEWWQFDSFGNLTKRTESATADATGRLTLDLDALPDQVVDAGVKVAPVGQVYTVYLSPIVK